MENKNYSTVFEADLAYLRSLGDTSECKTEFEVRLKTLRKLGGDIQTTTPLLYEIEKKILDFLGGDSSLYDNIYFLRKAIAERQGVNTEGLQTIYAIAVASLNSKPVVNYVTFTAEEANSTIGLRQLGTHQMLEYSTDTTNWNTMDTSTNITLANTGDKVYIRGILSGDNTDTDYTHFNISGQVAVSGNCNAIWNYQDLNAPLKAHCGDHLFNDCSIVTAPELPATELAYKCYYEMFRGCSSLVTGPSILPATTLVDYCYKNMFVQCSSLVESPILPATTLVPYCYDSMFYECYNIKKITCLATDNSAEGCTVNWTIGIPSGGTFVKNPDMNNWSIGSGGIPDGWIVKDPDVPYVTFKAEQSNSTIGLNKLSTNQTLEYSTDTTNWNTMDTSTSISLPNTGDKVYIRGILNGDNSTSNYTQFNISGQVAVSGNCNAIWNYQDLNAPLKAHCGDHLFNDCSIVTAPELPATELTEFCYSGMFNGCTSLVEAPELPATTLSRYCYYEMFNGCTSLVTAQKINATTLAPYCCMYMFNGCTSLVEAPELPATTLANDCYFGMFYNCTSLVTAPELPATKLKSNCYCGMFSGCTSLVESPVLYASYLHSFCYEQMFYGCSKLNKITCLANDGITNATTDWVTGVSSSGTFIKHPDNNNWTTGVSGIPSGWTVEDYNNSNFVTFTAEEANSTIGLERLSSNQKLEYSNDTISWNAMDTSTNITLANTGDEVYIRGILSANNDDANNTIFKMSGKIAASGNCNNIWNYKDLYAPLKAFCGYNLFNSCDALTQAPELPATELSEGCYGSMFRNCHSLTKIQSILPATTLAHRCYDAMFMDSTAITTAPELPATELSSNCYAYMFNSCTSLVEVPELPATHLHSSCYSSMFEGCSNLNKITCLATTIDGGSTDNWLHAVSVTGTFIKNPDMNDWTTGASGIPENWQVENYSESDGPDLTLPYVTFTAEEANSTIGLNKLSTNQTLEYSTDTNNWNTMDTSTSISLSNTGDKAYIRGILSAHNTGSNYTQFKMSGKIAASGNCNAIWNYQDLEAPIKNYCGYYLFSGCTSLTSAPELPATTLANNCYYCMFRDCTSLTTAPELPATTLTYYCYYCMFYNCTSLTEAPALHATTLANSCYNSMFYNCTSLTEAPELPATELAYYCYGGMFKGCTSLVEAPELPATTLAPSCYSSMFQNCSKLNKITCLATDISASVCTFNWVIGVSSRGTFIKDPNMTAWTTGTGGIPSGWTVEDYVG